MPSFGREFDATKDQKNLRGSRNNFRVLRFNGNLSGSERYSIALGMVCITRLCMSGTSKWLKKHLCPPRPNFFYFLFNLTTTQRKIKIRIIALMKKSVKSLDIGLGIWTQGRRRWKITDESRYFGTNQWLLLILSCSINDTWKVSFTQNNGFCPQKIFWLEYLLSLLLN